MGSENGGRADERFSIGEQIGQGGMAVVYAATERTSGRRVALKRLQTGSSAIRFGREVELLARVEHPSVVRYVGHGQDDDGPWLAMEWAEGEALSGLRVRPTVMESIAIAREVAVALAAIHDVGIVHRDIKPSNILVAMTPTIVVRVVDFGIAKDDDLGRLTTTGSVIGTTLYLTPEVIRGNRAEPRTDIHALGATLYELLSGTTPFAALTPYSVIGRILVEPAESLLRLGIKIPVELDALVMRMLDKEPATRPDAREVARTLDEIVARQALDDTAVLEDEQTVVGEPIFGAALVAREVELDVVTAVLGSDARTVQQMLDGTSIAWLEDARSLDAPLLRALRHAFRLAEQAPGATLIVTSAWTNAQVGATRRALAFDRLASMAAGRPGVFVDRETSSYLGTRFAVAPIEGGFEVLGERDADEGTLVLGRQTSTVGRPAELAQIIAVARAVRDEGEPRLVLVTDPADQEKSRLRSDLTTALREIEPAVEPWIVAFEPGSQSAPWAAFASVLRARWGIGESGRAALSPLLERVGLTEPEQTALTALLGLDLEEAGSDSLISRPEAWNERVADVLRKLLALDAVAGFVVLVLEDVHWADAASLRLVDALTRTSNLGLAVIAFARPDPASMHADLWRHRALTRIALRPRPQRAAQKP